MLESEAINVLVLHEDPLVSAGLTAILGQHRGIALVDAAAGKVDVVLADYERGLDVAATEWRIGPFRGAAPKVLVLSRRDSEGEIRHALAHGVSGYLTVGCGLSEIVDAVLTLHRGIRYVGVQAARRLADSIACKLLTQRETDVMRLLVEGHANKAIARCLGVTVGTVKTHLKSIFQKLDASSRTEVAAVAAKRGLLALTPALTARAPALQQDRRPAAPAQTGQVATAH